MSEFLKTKFNSKAVDKQIKKIEIYRVVVNDIPVEVTVDESSNTLIVHCYDYDTVYANTWKPFVSSKTFKEFVGQPYDIHYFLGKLNIGKDDFNLSKSKRYLYAYSIHNFHRNLSKEERTEWLSKVNELDMDTLFYEGDGDINFWAYTEGSSYINTEELNCKICDYSYKNLVIINGLIKVMEQIQKEVSESKEI